MALPNSPQVTSFGAERELRLTDHISEGSALLPPARQKRGLRAVQILLGHSSIENTVGYLGVDNDDALTLSAHTEI